MSGLQGVFYLNRPFPVSRGEVRLLFTGRIDNCEELSEIFKNQNLPAPAHNEEIILAAFKIWGASFATHLRGDFAIAVWDGANQKLLLARDPLGLKQLYYFQDSQKIIFASRISTLFEDPSVPKRPDETMIGQFFTGEFLDYERSFFEKISQVPPAHVLTFDLSGQKQKTRFWSPDIHKARVYRDKAQYLEEFRSLFENSVRRRIENSPSPALLLSGGLDSAQICAMAETLHNKNKNLPRLKSTCLLVEGFLCEEKAVLDALEERFQIGAELIDHYSNAQNVFELYLEPGEMPFYDAFLTVPLVLEKMAARGCKTLLTGYGANEYSNLMEFGYLEDLLLGLRFEKFSKEAGRFADCLHTSGREVKKMILMETLREKTPFFVRKMIRRRRLEKRRWLRPEFRKKIPAVPPPRLRPFGKLSQNETYHALFEPIIPLNLAQMSEAAEKYGMEINHPFMDLPLIEFFLSVPAEIKMEGGYRKNFMQRALAPIMPIPVKTQDDDRTFIPFKDDAARARLELPRLKKFFSNPDHLLYEYVDFGELQKISDPNSPALDYPLLWRMARLSAWLESYWGVRRDERVLINDIKDR